MTGLSSEHTACMLRPMDADDVEQVYQIEKDNFSDAWSRDGFSDALNQANTFFLVCEKNGQIVGYCCTYFVCGEAEIANVSVKKNFRNKQIATTMLTAVFDALKDRDVTAFTLEVRKSNLPAIHLYEKLGFVNEGIRPGFYSHPKEDAIIMWKR